MESTAQNKWEKRRLKEFKDRIQKIEQDEQKLREVQAQLKKMETANNPKYKPKIWELRAEKLHAEKRLDIRDTQLLRLEATKPLQDLLRREWDKAFKGLAEKYGKLVSGEKKVRNDTMPKSTGRRVQMSVTTNCCAASSPRGQHDGILSGRYWVYGRLDQYAAWKVTRLPNAG